MATTSLWYIKGSLKYLVNYVENPDKTNPNNELKDFVNVFNYDTNPVSDLPIAYYAYLRFLLLNEPTSGILNCSPSLSSSS